MKKQNSKRQNKVLRKNRAKSCSSQIKLLTDKTIILQSEFDVKSKFRRQSCEGIQFGIAIKEKTLVCTYIGEVKQHRRKRLQTLFKQGTQESPRSQRHRRFTSFDASEVLKQSLTPTTVVEPNKDLSFKLKASRKSIFHNIVNNKQKDQIQEEFSNFRNQQLHQRYQSWQSINYPQISEFLINSQRIIKEPRIKTSPSQLINHQKYIYGLSKSFKQIPDGILKNEIPVTKYKNSLQIDKSQKYKNSLYIDKSQNQNSIRLIVLPEITNPFTGQLKIKTKIAFRTKRKTEGFWTPMTSCYKIS